MSRLRTFTKTRTRTNKITPIKTMVEPVGKSNSEDTIKPTKIENSEKIIENKMVCLKLFPIGILDATGIIKSPDTKRTPMIFMKIEITIARMIVINIE